MEDAIKKSSEHNPPQTGEKATVENEEGETLEVLYDPILKCYYEPKSNTYYELNWFCVYYFKIIL